MLDLCLRPHILCTSALATGEVSITSAIFKCSYRSKFVSKQVLLWSDSNL